MAHRNADLHGNVPEQCPVALLLLDVINDMEFPEGDLLVRYALPVASRLRALKLRATRLGIPAIYVNDNFGRWRSDLGAQVRHCLNDGVRGEPVVRRLKPTSRDYAVLKPKHSGFYSTSLDILLRYLGTQKVIVTGFAGNICVLFTANDAYLRDLDVIVPSDCCASNEQSENEHALKQMQALLKADIRPSTELDLEALMGSRKGLRRRRPGRRPSREGRR